MTEAAFGPLDDMPDEAVVTEPGETGAPLVWPPPTATPAGRGTDGRVTEPSGHVAAGSEAATAPSAAPVPTGPVPGTVATPAPSPLERAGSPVNAVHRHRRRVLRRLHRQAVGLSVLATVLAGVAAMAASRFTWFGAVVTVAAGAVGWFSAMREESRFGTIAGMFTVLALYLVSGASAGTSGGSPAVLTAARMAALAALSALLWGAHSAAALAESVDPDAAVEPEVVGAWVRHQAAVLGLSLLPGLVALTVQVSDQGVLLAGLAAVLAVAGGGALLVRLNPRAGGGRGD